jgi:hypothetical protein
MDTTWPKQSACLKTFGNPFAPGWAAKNIVRVPPPFAMSMGDIHIPAIQINKIAAASLTRVLNAIADECDHDPKKLADIHATMFSGSFVLRQMRGLHTISMHAYALAIDLDAPNNALGAKAGHTFFTPDSIVVKCFEAENWQWGGRWKGRADFMHFQAAIVG